MGLYDSFYAGLACPNCGCQASVEAQVKDFENAMLTFSIGEPVELLAQADFRGLARCRWCDASVEVPILVREGRFIGFGEPALMAPQPIPLPPPPVKNPMKAGEIAEVVRADKRAVQKTLEQLERALGMLGGRDQAASGEV